MKKKLIKSIIKECVKTCLLESANTDPTKEEMINYLKALYGNESGFSDDAEAAIYWFASDYHGGQWSNLYSVLSTSRYEPGTLENGVRPGSMSEIMYQDLENEFAKKYKSAKKETISRVDLDKGMMKAVNLNDNISDGNSYTVDYAVAGLEQIPPSSHSSINDALSAARDFIQSYNTAKSRQAGEKFIALPKNRGYALRHVGGGTVAIATVSHNSPKEENIDEQSSVGSSTPGGQEGGTIRTPAWVSKNKEGSPGAIAAAKKYGKVVKSISEGE